MRFVHSFSNIKSREAYFFNLYTLLTWKEIVILTAKHSSKPRFQRIELWPQLDSWILGVVWCAIHTGEYEGFSTRCEKLGHSMPYLCSYRLWSMHGFYGVRGLESHATIKWESLFAKLSDGWSFFSSFLFGRWQATFPLVYRKRSSADVESSSCFLW